MLFLLDSNAAGDVMRNHPRVRSRLHSLPATDRVILCPITRGELLYGVERLPDGKRKRELQADAETVIRDIDTEPVPPTAGDIYARIKADRQRQGLSLDDNDLWIAATALALGATLVTRDTDFRNLPGLAIEDWTA